MGLAILLALSVFISAVTFACVIPRGEPPDELAHLTYVHEIAVGGRLIPDYTGSRIMGKGGGNYLQHPPLYYTALGLLGRATGQNPYEAHIPFRVMSSAMVAVGVFFWVLTAFALRIPPSWIVVSVMAVCCIPMFTYVAGSVNNDNLAYLGVAVAVYGLVRTESERTFAFVAGAGVLIAFLTKATAALFLLALCIIWLSLLGRAALQVLARVQTLVAGAIVASVCLAYYMPTVILHGTLFPHPVDLYPPQPPSNPMAFFDFAWEFVSTMFRRLPVVGSHNSIYPLNGVLNYLFWCMLLTSGLVWAASRIRCPVSAHRRLSDAFVLALFVTAVVHLFVMWHGYQSFGKVAGTQPRYYAYALPGIFLFASSNMSSVRTSVRLLRTAFGALVVVLAVTVTPVTLLTRASMEPAIQGPPYLSGRAGVHMR